MSADDDRYPFHFLRMNQRSGKPRTRGVTEIRGPYYSMMGRRYLAAVLETIGDYKPVRSSSLARAQSARSLGGCAPRH
jgi:hypothetical protein